tara:strand:- start:1550 stop:2053 length:504 start_codon:yes stop_codon:yes gene_type:complete
VIKSIKTTFDFAKLASKSKQLIKEFKEKTILTESNAMKKRLQSGMTINGQMDEISDVAKITRILRGHNPSAPPLNASGRLLKSIKPIKSGVSVKKYGLHQSEGFTTKNNPVIPEGNKKPKGGLKKRQFKFAGKKIPSRKWIHSSETFKNDKGVVNDFFKDLRKALKK